MTVSTGGKPRRFLITGGSGFIGTNLVEHYLKQSASVLNVDINPPRNAAHQEHWLRKDICHRDDFIDAVKSWRPDVILHFAARTDVKSDNVSDYSANTVGVSNVIEAAAQLDVRPTVVFASSLLVCRLGYVPGHDTDYCPINAYGQSKVEGETRVRREAAGKFPWIIVRPTSIWGPWFGSPYYEFFGTVRRGWYVHPRGLSIERHYGFVLNTVSQIDALLGGEASHLTSKTVYLGDYEPINVKVWANAIRSCYGMGPVREFPLAFFKLGAILGDSLKTFGVDFPMTSYRLSNLLTMAQYDLSPMRRIAPTLKYGLDDAVKITCEWLARARTNPAVRQEALRT